METEQELIWYTKCDSRQLRLLCANSEEASKEMLHIGIEPLDAFMPKTTIFMRRLISTYHVMNEAGEPYRYYKIKANKDDIHSDRKGFPSLPVVAASKVIEFEEISAEDLIQLQFNQLEKVGYSNICESYKDDFDEDAARFHSQESDVKIGFNTETIHADASEIRLTGDRVEAAISVNNTIVSGSGNDCIFMMKSRGGILLPTLTSSGRNCILVNLDAGKSVASGYHSLVLDMGDEPCIVSCGSTQTILSLCHFTLIDSSGDYAEILSLGDSSIVNMLMPHSLSFCNVMGKDSTLNIHEGNKFKAVAGTRVNCIFDEGFSQTFIIGDDKLDENVIYDIRYEGTRVKFEELPQYRITD